MDGQGARTWGWILVGMVVVGVGLLVAFAVSWEEGCDPDDRLPGGCQRGDGGGAFSQPEEGAQDPRGSADGVTGLLGSLFLVVGGVGAPLAFRKARQGRARGVHPFGAPHPPGAMIQSGSPAPFAGGPAPPAGTISSGGFVNLGVASTSGMPLGVMLGAAGLVATASDGTHRPAFWSVREGRIHVLAAGSSDLSPVALSVPVVDAHALLRQWAPLQELTSQRPPT